MKMKKLYRPPRTAPGIGRIGARSTNSGGMFTSTLPNVYRSPKRTYSPSHLRKRKKAKTNRLYHSTENPFFGHQPLRPSTAGSVERVSRKQKQNMVEYRKRRQLFDSFLPMDYIPTKSFPSDSYLDYSLGSKKKRVNEAFSKIFEIISNPKVHPNIKSRYFSDLFQISTFYYNESKILEKEAINLRMKNESLEEELQMTSSSRRDLVVPEPSLKEFEEMRSSVDKLQTEIFNYKKDAKSPEEKMSEISFLGDPDLLSESVSENDSTEEGDGDVRPTVDKYLNCVKQKFNLLEEFVCFLKKRISILEQSDADIERLVSRFGSAKELLEENRRIEKENNLLKWVKRRFDTDVLLDRELMKVNSVPFLKSIIFALQTELFYSKQTVDQLIPYNKKNNLVIVQKYPVDFRQYWNTKYSSLINLMSDDYKSEVIDELLKKEDDLTEEEKIIQRLLNNERDDEYPESIGSHDLHQDELLQKIAKDENKKELTMKDKHIQVLEDIISRNKLHVEELERSMKLLESQIRRSEGMFKIKELDTSLRRQLSQIQRLNVKLEKREKFYVFQEKLLEKFRADKIQLMNQNIKCMKKIKGLESNNKLLKERMVSQGKGIQILNNISTGLLKIYFENNTNKQGVVFKGNKIGEEQYMRFLYRDMFKNYTQMVNATVKIQSWWRGVKKRRELLKNGFYLVKVNKNKSGGEGKVETPTVLDDGGVDKLVVHSESFDDSESLVDRLAKLDSNSTVKKKSNSSSGNQETVDNKEAIKSSDQDKMKMTFNTMYLLQKSNVFGPKRQESLRKFKFLLSNLKNEISENLQTSISKEIRSTQRDIFEISEKIIERVKQSENIVMLDRSVQTFDIEKSSVSSQIGVTQISVIRRLVSNSNTSSSTSNSRKKSSKRKDK